MNACGKRRGEGVGGEEKGEERGGELGRSSIASLAAAELQRTFDPCVLSFLAAFARASIHPAADLLAPLQERSADRLGGRGPTARCALLTWRSLSSLEMDTLYADTAVLVASSSGIRNDRILS